MWHACNVQVLTGKAKQEAEEAQRILCGALNGLAALHLIDQDHSLAIKTYRQVCHRSKSVLVTKCPSLPPLEPFYSPTACDFEVLVALSPKLRQAHLDVLQNLTVHH